MTQTIEQSKSRSAADKITIYHNRTWEQFKHLQKGLEGSPGVRLSFYQGIVEIFMPGQPHEIFKKIIAALLEAFFLHWRIRVVPTGSFTQEQAGVAAVEADESYCFGSARAIPDLSIEVIFASGSATKLECYRALGVPEVWFWEDGLFTLHRLGEQGYSRIDKSQILELAALDFELLTRCVLAGETDWLEAVLIFKEALSRS